jgi:polyisoprenoid-binding protein YceI
MTVLTRSVAERLVPETGTYALDASHSTVDFVARHLVVAKVRGTFTGVTGELTVGAEPESSTLSVTIDMSSVNTREEARDTHLRSADFFDVANYPEMKYVSTSVRPVGDHWIIDGELTVHGVSKVVPLNVEFLGGVADPWGGERIAFSANAEIDREHFGLTWNAALEAGGVVVSRNIKIEIEAEFVRQP